VLLSDLRLVPPFVPSCLRAFVPLLMLSAAASAYTPPPGFETTGQSFPASAVAVAPDGKVAVGIDNFAGGASISIYSSLAHVGGTPIKTFTHPTWKFIAGIAWADSSTLVFGENGDLDTVLRAGMADATATPLAALGSIPAVADLTIRGSTVYAVSAAGPGANSVLSVPLAGGTPSSVITGFGTGYGGGIAFDSAGTMLLTDTNDPAFVGNPGRVLRYDAALNPLSFIDLSPAGGSGAVDLLIDDEGDILVTSGRRLTRIVAGTLTVEPFGAFDDFSFPTYLAYVPGGFEPYAGTGRLIVSGFNDQTGYFPGAAFVIAPAVPEPAACAVVLVACGAVLARRRGDR